MVDHINHIRGVNIITIEDPVEYRFTQDKSIISQREIGIDVPDFPTALRSVVRQDPDVILIGEMRDHDTILAAIQAAETGHLVFATLHTSTRWARSGACSSSSREGARLRPQRPRRAASSRSVRSG
jgi:twitching motility protein PilT